jgi:acetyl esterase/lipase
MQILRPSFFAVALALLAASDGFAQNAPNFKRTEDVIYGRKFGTALTLDVLQPTAKNNGYGVVFMVSGGWFSAHDAINPKMYAPLLDRGYTIFAVVHGSQPRFIITEITEDIHRAIRFIRTNAAQWGVQPEKLGITGGSAGGHLSLTMATKGRPGNPEAKDPIDRASSAVQAVAWYFAPNAFM